MEKLLKNQCAYIIKANGEIVEIPLEEGELIEPCTYVHGEVHVLDWKLVSLYNEIKIITSVIQMESTLQKNDQATTLLDGDLTFEGDVLVIHNDRLVTSMVE